MVCAEAIDSKGILAIVVQVVDESGAPVEGVTVTLPRADITKLKETAKDLGLSTQSTEQACRVGITDKLGTALIYYSGGTQSTVTEYVCSLPRSIELKYQEKKSVTIDLSKRGMLSVKPNEAVMPYVTATLSTR